MDFSTAWNIIRAEITPQPWTYTAGGATLTIEPAGLPAEEDGAEVVFQVGDVMEWVRTPDVQRLVDALTAGESWGDADYGWGLDVAVADDGVTVAIVQDRKATPVTLPASERMPLASAIRRALDVARAWED
ncbi:hypothetical protein ABZX82_02025 [Streptomyces griseoflavus]|uniref:hypothetical protein n=1 Tax=Streptomyces griseoflavus TaxID=35619 RepID=UPI0033B8B63E